MKLKQRIKNLIRPFFLYIAKKNKYARQIMLKIKFLIKNKKYKSIAEKLKVDEKKIIFESFNGRKYCDSPKMIYENLLNDKKYKEYNFVWCFKELEKYEFLKSERTNIVKYASEEYKREYASAKYWITCSRLMDYLIPKKDQNYVQCWHGTPFKRLGADIQVKGKSAINPPKEWAKKHEFDSSKYAYLVSPSSFTTEKLKSAFKIKTYTKIIEKGYPRNDSLYNYTNETLKLISKKLGLENKGNKKIILYAPTWRDDQHSSKIGYIYECKLNFEKFKKEFKDKYIILFRSHYLIANYIDFKKYDDFVINVSDYDDVNDLYIVSDILITDYSSVFFDYANLRKPIIFYMYDLEDYRDNMRDFYIDLEELPGPIITEETELYLALKKLDNYWEEYKKIYKKFNARFNYLEDGNATKRVIKEIFDISSSS